jgi:uncharacterized protein
MTQAVGKPGVRIDARKARSILRALHAGSAEIENSALVTSDGLVLASELRQQVNVDRFAAMSAALLALATRAAKEVDCGELRQLILDGTSGPMLLTSAGRVGVLAVSAGPSAMLGKLVLDARNAARALDAALDEPSASLTPAS